MPIQTENIELENKNLFPGQQPDEGVYLVIRQHWFYLLTKLLLWLVFILIFFAINHFGPVYLPNLFVEPYLAYINLAKNMLAIFIFLGVFITWVLYYLNIQIITSKRIVDISQDSLFNHTVSELNLLRIQDVTGETKGFLGTMFSFGNVYVQTAAERERFTFANIPHPEKVEKLVLDLSENLTKSQPATNSQEQADSSMNN